MEMGCFSFYNAADGDTRSTAYIRTDMGAKRQFKCAGNFFNNDLSALQPCIQQGFSLQIPSKGIGNVFMPGLLQQSCLFFF